MKNFKKFLTLVLAVMMVVSSVAFSTSAVTTKFEDVDADNEVLVKAVDLLSYMGVAKGTSETTFGADELVTRQQFALFIYRLMKGGKDAPAGAANSTAFTDLEDATYTYAIAWANAEGIVNGKSATTFGPKDPIKLQEAYAMIVRALDWEETKELVYPFGHIEVAEQKGVELDNGLASSVGYADELTRGDMAILLYNAFFAKTGVEEVSTIEREIGEYIYDDMGTPDDESDDEIINTPNWVLQEYTYNPRLCEKAFEVVELEYKATGTPNYKLVLGDVYAGEVTYDLGYDAIYFEKVAGSEVNAKTPEAPQSTYIKAEDLGMDAKELNDVFMGEFTIFATLDDDNDIEKVLFADCNMTKKTVTDIKLGEVASNKAKSYYAASEDLNEDGAIDEKDHYDAKLLSGKLTADGEEIYVYNAPYSYAKPVYGTVSAAATKYALRNEKNIQAISFSMDTVDEENVYEVEISELVSKEVADDNGDPVVVSLNAYDSTGFYTEAAESLVKNLAQVYYGGLYEADLFDVDGDGLYDYINYKPYSVFQVDNDEDYYFEDSFDANLAPINGDLDIPYIYTQDAKVIADVDYASEDVVIGYFSEDLEVIRIAAVVKPTVDTIANSKPTTGTLYLAGGEKVDAVNSWKLIANSKDASANVVFDADEYNEALVDADLANTTDSLFDAWRYDSEAELAFYIYDGVLLFTDNVTKLTKFSENLIIPTTLGGDYPVEKGGFDSETGERAIYVYAFVDGTKKYVQVLDDEDVDVNDVVEKNNDGTYVLNYEDMLCTYEVKDGIYYITPLEVDVNDEDGNEVSTAISTDPAVLDNEKKEDQFFKSFGTDELTVKKVAGTRFNLMNWDSVPENATRAWDDSIELKSYSKIVIREYDAQKDEYKYLVYDASTFKKSLHEDTVLTNVKVILSNNKDSETKENLVVLYAETTKFDFKGDLDKNGYRIVSNYDLTMTDDNEWMISYELYDPYTGAKVYEVPSVETARKATGLTAIEAGTMVNLVEGKVDKDYCIDVTGDDAYVAADDILADSTNVVWIAEVDTVDEYFAVVPYMSVTDREDAETKVEAALANEDAVNDMYGDVLPGNFIDYDKNTVVSVMTYGEYNSNFWKWGSMSLSNMSAIADGKKEVLCYNDEVLDKNDNYVTKYSDYVKAYVSVDRDVEDDENPVAEFVIVIVHGGEAAAQNPAA